MSDKSKGDAPKMVRKEQADLIVTAWKSPKVKAILTDWAAKLVKKSTAAAEINYSKDTKTSPAKRQAEALCNMEIVEDFAESMEWAAEADAWGAIVSNNQNSAGGKILAADYAQRCISRMELKPFDDAVFERDWPKASDKNAERLWKDIKAPAIAEVRKQIASLQAKIDAASGTTEQKDAA